MRSLPKLPDNQRWSVTQSFNMFLHVKLQERRWWGWRTIASSIGSLAGGEYAVADSVDRILRRDYFAQLRAEAEQERAQRQAQIPFGYTKGERDG